jgi:hypothetical protein
MKTLSFFFLVMSLVACNSQQQAPTDNSAFINVAVDKALAEKLSGFPGLQLIEVEDIIEPMLDGRVTIAISREKLTDNIMSRFDNHPVMALLTAPLPEDEKQRLAMQSGEQLIERPWYLYRLKSIPESERQNVEQQLTWLFSDEAQRQLADRELLPLPEPLRQRARVILGLEQPIITGGYR